MFEPAIQCSIDVFVDECCCYVCMRSLVPVEVREVTVCRRHYEMLKDSVSKFGGRVVDDTKGGGG